MDEARAVWWRLVLRPILPLMVAVPVTEFLARTMRGLGPLWAIQQDSFVQVAIASIAVVFCVSLTNRRLALLAVGGGVLAFDVLNGVLSAMPLAQKYGIYVVRASAVILASTVLSAITLSLMMALMAP